MDSILVEISIIVILAILNGIFAMSELAVVSANHGRLSSMAASGNRGAAIALKLASNSGQFLATVQVGITLIGIISGVFGGATLGEDLATYLTTFNIQVEVAEPLSFVIVVGCITYLSLILGELVPKQIALSYPEAVACFMSRPLLLLSKVGAPLVWLLEKSGVLALRLLPFEVGHRNEVSEDDIRSIITQGASTGEIHRAEKEIALRVFRLDERPISAFMTARPDIVWLDIQRPFEELWNIALNVPHSFFPVCDGSIDNVLGIISIKELWVMRAAESGAEIRNVLRPAINILASRDALSVLEEFKRERRQVAIVVDEHGGIDGIVTTHDLLEAIVGDLADYEGEERSIVSRHDGTLLVDATVDIHELLLFMKMDRPEGMPVKEYQSVGGVIFGELRKLPTLGSRIKWSGLEFEVIDMDGHRMDKVLVSKIG